MPRQVFVSYPYDDARNLRGQLERWEQDGTLGNNTLRGENEDVRFRGEAAIRAHLRSRMKLCSAMIVLVGDNSHGRKWLDYEAAIASSEQMKIVVVRIPRTSGAAPALLRSLPETSWRADSIVYALS